MADIDDPEVSDPDWPKHVEEAVTAAATVDDGVEVVAFPLGWDDPQADTLDSPVQGLLSTRTVETPFGTYDQWLVGGEVIDPATVTSLDGKALD